MATIEKISKNIKDGAHLLTNWESNMTKQLLIVVTMIAALNSIYGCASKPPRTDLLPVSASICLLVDTKDTLWLVNSHDISENIVKRIVKNITSGLAEDRITVHSGEACKPIDMKLDLKIDTIETGAESSRGFFGISTTTVQTYSIRFTTTFLTPESKVLFSQEKHYTGSQSLDDLLKDTSNYASDRAEDFYGLSVPKSDNKEPTAPSGQAPSR
jgi:hypothetical protein